MNSMLNQMERTIISPRPEVSGLQAIRRINRYELKYVVDRNQVSNFRQDLPSRLERDPYGIDGFYPVWSIYYDTPDLHFYWEKIDGERFRRKLRIRHYGTPDDLTPATPVWVEIKQRINRVTQKRRVRLPYAEALRLCAGKEPTGCATEDERVAEEILVLSNALRLVPVVAVGYVREAYLGTGQDSGLRLTIDSRVRGRDRDLGLDITTENRFIIEPHLSVVEVKVNDRVPYWMTEQIARHNLGLRRISKYCQGIQTFDVQPRSTVQQERFESLSDNPASV